MKSICVGVLSLGLFSNFALANDASCVEKLLSSQDSKAHRIETREYFGYTDTEWADGTERAVREISKKNGCQLTDLVFTERSCKMLNPKNWASYACFLESENANFFVSRDYLDNVHVIVNRLD